MIAIFDIDGTVADDRWRRNLIDYNTTDRVKRYERYHCAAAADEPINRHLLEKHVLAGNNILFATSRPINYYEATSRWVRWAFSNTPHMLVMRALQDARPSPEVKLMMVQSIAEEYDIVQIYEDREDVCSVLRQEGYPVTYVTTCSDNPAEAVAGENDGLLDHPSAAEILQKGAATYAARNAAYGDNYKRFGYTMESMFPMGLKVRTAEDWNRLGVFVQIVSKLTRFANADMQHSDSVHDLMVYAAMMEELLNG